MFEFPLVINVRINVRTSSPPSPCCAKKHTWGWLKIVVNTATRTAGVWGTTTGGSCILADGAAETLCAMAMVMWRWISDSGDAPPKRSWFFQRLLGFVNSLWIIWPDCCWMCCHAPSNLHGYPWPHLWLDSVRRGTLPNGFRQFSGSSFFRLYLDSIIFLRLLHSINTMKYTILD